MLSNPIRQLVVSPDAASEDYRRSAEWDVSAGPGNYLTLVGTQAIGSGLALAAIWLATRALGPSGYGGVAAIFAASQCIGQLFVHWTAVSLARYGCEEFVKTGRIARTFWSRSLILIPNLLIVAGTSPLWLPLLGKWLHIPPSVSWLVVAHLLITALLIHIQQGLLAAKLPRVQGAVFALERALVVSVLLALVLAGKASVLTVALAYVGGSLGACVIGAWRLRALVFVRISFDRPLFKKIFAFSLPLIPYSLTAYLSTNFLDAFFITRFLSVADLGIYTVAYLLAGTLTQFPLLVGTLLLPFFITLQVSGREERIARYLREVLPLLTLGWSAVCAVMATAGVYLLPIVFGAQFQSTTELLWPLMAMSALAGPVLMGYGAISNASSATYMSAATSAASAGVKVILNFLLIPAFGLTGCAWATVAAYGASLLLWIYLIDRRVPSSFGRVIEAAMPVLLGAAYASWRADYLGALIVSMSAMILVATVRRKDVLVAFRTLESAEILKSPIRPMLKREAY